MKYLLGIDAGTTSFKAVLFDEEGKEVAASHKDYELIRPDHSIVEFCVEDYWIICKAIIRDLFDKSQVVNQQIAALAISSQGETLICVDRQGSPLRNAIVWLDGRSKKQADIIRNHFGAKQVYDITGQPEIVATWPATKIMWLKKHEKDVFAKTRKFLLLEDYLIYKLTGRYVAEKSLLSSTILLDINTGKWWDDMLELIGISSEVLPEIMQSGRVVGLLTDEASAGTGLDQATLVITGALDQIAGMIGAGNIKQGIVTETTGTAMAMAVNIDKPVVYNPAFKIPCHHHAIEDKYCLLLWSETAGMVLKWFCDNFYSAEKEQCCLEKKNIFQLMDDAAETIAPGCNGLIMLPHLNGVACPDFNPHIKGDFSGITLQHTKSHFTRAIMESIAYMLNQNIQLLHQLRIEVEQILSLGGGARSKLWNTIKADVTGKTIVTVNSRETACLGAAMLAGVGAAVFQSIDKACDKMVSIDQRINPNPSNKDIYQKGYKRYLQLYESMMCMADVDC